LPWWPTRFWTVRPAAMSSWTGSPAVARQ
jgi:hypothetical protein